MTDNNIVLSQPELCIAVSLDRNPIPVDDGKVCVNVLLEVNPAIPTQSSKPLDICFVVDCSGSMGGQASRKSQITKIQAVRNALVNLLSKMSPADRIRVIGFSDFAFEILPWTHVGQCDLNAVTKILENELRDRSCTYFAPALKMSLVESVRSTGLPIIVLLTDGQSSSPRTDHPFMVSYADEMRKKQIPLIIYGTGEDYNLNLLQQIAIRAGNGSLLYHVLSVEDLESHLTGEMAFLHGHCLENVHISVSNANAKFTDVYRFVPQEQQLHGQTPNDGGSFVSELARGFENACGALDHMRGQKFLFRIELPLAAFRTESLFQIIITGNKPCEIPFRYIAEVPASITTEDVSATPPNAEVDVYLKMVEASKAVQHGNVEKAAEIYDHMGLPDLAHTLRQIQGAGESEEATSRGTESFSRVAVSEYLRTRLAEESGEKS